MESPETTGKYECSCGNKTIFTGIDKRGYPGDDCECGNDLCTCEVELKQDFTVPENYPEAFVPDTVVIAAIGDCDIDYHEFTGGGCGAEIGHYSSILCRACGRTIWSEDEWLQCTMCGADNAFKIDANDPALGYCRVEDKWWRIEKGPNYVDPSTRVGTESNQ